MSVTELKDFNSLRVSIAVKRHMSTATLTKEDLLLGLVYHSKVWSIIGMAGSMETCR